MAERARVVLRLIREIPRDMLNAFKKETRAHWNIIKETENAEVKIGAFVGKELVGFIAGRDQNLAEYNSPEIRFFYVPGLYVKQEFRRMNIGTRLVRKIGNEARKRGHNEFTMSRMTAPTKQILEKEQQRLENKKWGKTKNISITPFGLGLEGKIRFPRRRGPK